MPTCANCKSTTRLVNKSGECPTCQNFGALVFGQNKCVAVRQRAYGDDFSSSEITWMIPNSVDEGIIPFLINGVAEAYGSNKILSDLCSIRARLHEVWLSVVVKL